MNNDPTYGLLLRIKERLEDHHQERQRELGKIAHSLAIIETCAVMLTVLGWTAFLGYVLHALGWV